MAVASAATFVWNRGYVLEQDYLYLIIGVALWDRAPADVGALVELLLCVSGFVVANAAEIQEMDLNPVWVGARGQGAIPLDAVIVTRK